MRKKGSVTVSFAVVFVIVFSFILSFFELASHVARASYHASASLLATENFFAAYVRPMYEEYHIFGREVSEGDKILSSTEAAIGGDVSYMTEKKETERSLLLRSGAEFGVTEAKVLTSDGAEGFYRQAVTTMKYRGVSEVADLLKEFSGLMEQANTHLEVAETKAETDSAYGKVDERILELIGLIDGVDIVKYEKFLGGKGVLFQKDAYVKYFCTHPDEAVASFDRTEVYQAFLSNHENPCDTLEDFADRAEELAKEIEERESSEFTCRSRLASLRGSLAVKEAEKEQLEEDLTRAKRREWAVTARLGVLLLEQEKSSEWNELVLEREELIKTISELEAKEKEWKASIKELKDEIKEWEKEESSLEKKKKKQEKSVKTLVEEEKIFVEQAEMVREICEEAYECVKGIQTELKTAKTVRAVCETVLSAAQNVVGEDAVAAYQEDLDTYDFYEDVNGYDFEEMKQTLLENKSVLWNVKQTIIGADAKSLREAAKSLRMEGETVHEYSFHGLKLDYGEMSLAGDLYDGIEDVISDEVASGFLGFLTDKELSDKTIDTAYLPSGFRSGETDFTILSLLGTDMSGVFGEMQGLLPESKSLGEAMEGILDPVLFHSYLTTHFSDYSEEKAEGAVSYELEYIIAGKDSDQENLSSVATRICVIRTILHFISLYSDGEKKAPVEQAALAVCGAIGLPALKSIVEFFLLFVWALEEAVIDTAAFLQGKKLALYPGKDGGCLAFGDILRFSKEFVAQMAEKKEDAKGIAMGYRGYVHLFLFLTSKADKSYRALDLIQENLRKDYEDSFRVNRCVWKISYEVDGKDYSYAYE